VIFSAVAESLEKSRFSEAFPDDWPGDMDVELVCDKKGRISIWVVKGSGPFPQRLIRFEIYAPSGKYHLQIRSTFTELARKLIRSTKTPH